MKLIFIVTLILFLPFAAKTQTSLIWQKCYGGTAGEYANDILLVTGGGMLIAGYSDSNNGDISGNHGDDDFLVMKTDDNGNILWSKCYGGTDREEAEAVVAAPGGGYIVAGYTNSTDGDVSGNHGSADVWIIKIDDNGNLLWQKCIGGSSDDYGADVTVTQDGGFIVCGRTYSNNGDITNLKGYSDVLLTKADASGNLVWAYAYGGTEFEESMGIAATTDGGAVVCGRTASTDMDVSGNHGNDDSWVIKVGITGTLEWQKCLGGTEDEEANDIIVTSDGGYAVLGYTDSNNGDITSIHSAENDWWFVKLSSAGALQWQKCYGGSNDDQAEALCATADGGYILTGLTTSTEGDVSGTHGSFFPIDIWVARINSSGTLLWQRACGGTDQDEAHAVKELSNGQALVCGYTYSTNGDVSGNHGNKDAWVLKVSGTAGAVEETSTMQFSVYPVPARDQLTITCEKNAEIIITGIDGRRMITISAKSEITNIDLNGLCAGLYFLTINGKNGTGSSRIIIE